MSYIVRRKQVKQLACFSRLLCVSAGVAADTKLWSRLQKARGLQVCWEVT